MKSTQLWAIAVFAGLETGDAAPAIGPRRDDDQSPRFAGDGPAEELDDDDRAPRLRPAMFPPDTPRHVWRRLAECVGQDLNLFFPGQGGSSKQAVPKKFCAACPVAGDCHAYAESLEINDGIWGGKLLGTDKEKAENEEREERRRERARRRYQLLSAESA